MVMGKGGNKGSEGGKGGAVIRKFQFNVRDGESILNTVGNDGKEENGDNGKILESEVIRVIEKFYLGMDFFGGGETVNLNYNLDLNLFHS